MSTVLMGVVAMGYFRRISTNTERYLIYFKKCIYNNYRKNHL
jgi:hypothetical protein